MALVLTDEQELLRRTAREFVSARSSLKRIRQLRDRRDPTGFSRELWSEMARLGWAGILVPEHYGGAGLGYTELMVQVAGPQGLGWDGDGFEPAELKLTRDWLRSRGNTIEGGTSEVQLNIIAKNVLGLPD